jgi:Prokaryotic homologs of the JAB domain
MQVGAAKRYPTENLMLTLPYHFALALYGPDATSVGTAPATHDWTLAQEWTRFHYQRRGELPLDANEDACVLPLWNHQLGEPYCRGYRVEISRPGQRPVSADFPVTHFAVSARQAASLFIERQELREGERYSYLLLAYPAPKESAAEDGLSVTNASPRMPVGDASLEALRARAEPAGVEDGDDMAVFVSRQVLREAEAQTAAERGTETGGILVGMLWRDKAAGEIFAEVTAQVPAEHSRGTSVKLTFLPETWAAADAALRLRGRGETYLGYWHSHPVREWCKARECAIEKQKTCPLGKDFFSEDDEAVMRAAFPRAYSIALVANDTAFSPLTFSLFGNREGTFQPRGFCVLED